MIRRRFVTGAIALATATVIAANGTANAQEIGTPRRLATYHQAPMPSCRVSMAFPAMIQSSGNQLLVNST